MIACVGKKSIPQFKRRFRLNPVRLILPQGIFRGFFAIGRKGTITFASQIFSVIGFDAHLRMFSELEVERRAIFGSSREIHICFSVNFSKFSIPAFELVFSILEMEFKDLVRTSVAFETCSSRASHSNKTMLTA